MARNTQVAADLNAPPVTSILATFVSSHPSRRSHDAVEHEAHRTFLNWVGCAVGASRHESAEAAQAGVRMLAPAPHARSRVGAAEPARAGVRRLAPAPQSSILGRAEKVDMASAALVNGITSHTFDFDD